MKGSKLKALLQKLSPKEQKQFLAYVESPFFNKNGQLIKLSKFILVNHSTLDQVDFESAAFQKQFFPQEALNEDKVNNLLSDLLQLLYGYLTQVRFTQKHLKTDQFLLEELMTRGAFKHLDRKLKQYRKSQDQTAARSYEYFLRDYYYYEVYETYTWNQQKQKLNDNIQLLNNSLDAFYFIDKFRLACQMTARNKLANTQYTCHFIDSLRTLYGQVDHLGSIPALDIYVKALNILEHPEDESNYRVFKEVLMNTNLQLTQEEAQPIYSYALNYCVKRITSGDSSYYREILEWYQLMLKRGVIFVNGYLTQWSFLNIVTTGLRLKEFEWTERFIHQYKEHLVPEQRTNAIAYNLAALYFEKKDYGQALSHLHNVEFSETGYHLNAKIIQIKSFYELDESETFFAIIETFKKFLQRNKGISDHQKKANNNFLRLIKQLYQLRLNQGLMTSAKLKKKLNDIELKFETLTPLGNKAWLSSAFKQIKDGVNM